MRSIPGLVVAIVCLSTQSACGCNADLQQDLNPTERTITVGESFTPSARFLGCSGTEPLADEITWSASDTAIVRVDALSGRTTGVGLGRATVVPSGRRYGRLNAVRVTVRAP